LDTSASVKKGTFPLRIASGKLFLPDDVGARIENLYPTEEGTLRTVEGPLPYLPNYATGGAPAAAFQANITIPRYGYMHGVFQGNIGPSGERDILLIHTGSEIWEFQGWNRGWSKLIASAGSPGPAPAIVAELLNSRRPNFPTQFEFTQNGVVIVPQNSRAYFYDGTCIAPLGFTEAPTAPLGLGPEDSLSFPDYAGKFYVDLDPGDPDPRFRRPGGVNDEGYAWDGLQGRVSGMIPSFRYGRLGFTRNPISFAGAGEEVVSSSPNAIQSPLNPEVAQLCTVGGWVEPGEWRAAVQFVDQWGNLSPLSGRSNPVTVSQQYSTDFVLEDVNNDPPHQAQGNSFVAQSTRVRKQVAWTGIERGPYYTAGRILHRTKDLEHAGTSQLFEVPLDSLENATTFATIPDNVTDTFPDNIPDNWLVAPAREVVAVPEFRLCRVAFGCLWIANTPGAPGLLRPSMPGRWGTFLANEELYPDPRGAEITGLWRVPQGLLAFTNKSTYLIIPAEGGGFTSVTVSSEAGCTAPNSICTLKSGVVMWMGADGFYAFEGTDSYSRGVTFISTDIDLFVQRVTESRRMQACAAVDSKTGEYRCWTSLDGSIHNNICFIFDGKGWRTRTDVDARDVCVTQDHRNYMISVGRAETVNGLWLVDHESITAQPPGLLNREGIIETAWLTAADSEEKRTAQVIYLWLRETENTTLTIEVMRDWRNTIIETTTAKRYSGDDIPKFWSETVLGSEGSLWQKKRPYWTRAAVYVPSAEVFKFRIRGAGKWEFVGLQIAESPRYAGGARIPP
jgi:hypothetical protein